MIVAMSRDIRVLVIKLDRPPPQHADDALSAAGDPGAGRPRDPRHLRTAGPPAGMNTIRGARGPRVRHLPSQDLRRDRADGWSPTRHRLATSSWPGDRPTDRPARSEGQGDGHRPAEALLLDLPEDDRGAATSPTSYDLVGIRVLVENNRDCYSVLGILHARWNPVLGRFRTTSRCRSSTCTSRCITTVIGPTAGQAGRAQIRTFAHAPARREYGVAAHWKIQGGRPRGDRHRAGRGPRRHDLGPPAAGLAEQPGRRPGSSSSRSVSRSTVPRSCVFHPARRRDRTPHWGHAGRLRLRRAHRGRPPRSAPGVSSRLVPLDLGARERRRRGLHFQADRRSRPATGSPSSSRRGHARRSASGSPRSGARRRSSAARSRSPS